MDKRAYYRQAEVAGAYDAVRFGTPAGQWTHERELRRLRDAFRPGARVLELACGTGRLLRALRAEGRRVTGVDQSPAMLREAGDDCVVGDVLHLPFPDQSFDGAYSFRFTNHCSDLRPFFREARRVVRPGGRLVFDTMSWSPLLRDVPRLGGRNFPVSRRKVRDGLREMGWAWEATEPLFLIGPYSLAKAPLWIAKATARLAARLPDAWSAVQVWSARRVG